LTLDKATYVNAGSTLPSGGKVDIN
jgi:hypothetical protein